MLRTCQREWPIAAKPGGAIAPCSRESRGFSRRDLCEVLFRDAKTHFSLHCIIPARKSGLWRLTRSDSATAVKEAIQECGQVSARRHDHSSNRRVRLPPRNRNAQSSEPNTGQKRVCGSTTCEGVCRTWCSIACSRPRPRSR